MDHVLINVSSKKYSLYRIIIHMELKSKCEDDIFGRVQEFMLNKIESIRSSYNSHIDESKS